MQFRILLLLPNTFNSFVYGNVCCSKNINGLSYRYYNYYYTMFDSTNGSRIGTYLFIYLVSAWNVPLKKQLVHVHLVKKKRNEMTVNNFHIGVTVG